jgi:hypothetical protein
VVRFTVYFFAALLLIPITAIGINASLQEWGDVKEWSRMLLAIVGTAVVCILYACAKMYTRSYLKQHLL